MREMSVFNAYIALSGACDARVLQNEPLARHTSYRVGGPAALFIEPHTHAALSSTLSTLELEGVPWVVVGRGSNILAADTGFSGAVICLGRDFSAINFEEQGTGVTVGSAAILSRLVTSAQARGLSGLECCAGIPGSVGGAVSMDAGTRRDWIGRAVESVVTLRSDGQLKRYASSEIEWGYRTTNLPGNEIILEVSFSLVKSDRASVAERMEHLLTRRRATQPTGCACCGSVFKNPPHRSAAKLIEGCELKGYRIGHAVVSTQHANFILNEGGASASDIAQTIAHVRNTVESRCGILLQTEVKYLGF